METRLSLIHPQYMASVPAIKQITNAIASISFARKKARVPDPNPEIHNDGKTNLYMNVRDEETDCFMGIILPQRVLKVF